LQRKLRIDLELDFKQINPELVERVKAFEPAGLGNPTPTFFGRKTEIIDVRTVGRDAKHLKLKLKQDEQVFDAIFFGGGENYSKLTSGINIDIAYQVEENIWNGYKNIQLKIKDIKTTD